MFLLTARERMAVIFILTSFVIGLAVQHWREVAHEKKPVPSELVAR
jgi:hypothetical protein